MIRDSLQRYIGLHGLALERLADFSSARNFFADLNGCLDSDVPDKSA